jgi:acyl carrier protein phosphodiesterase
MNYLAHLYLSGEDENLIFGNFIADHVKGKDFHLFSDNIKKGIILHRQIDQFTDTHPVVNAGKRRLYEYVGKYAPVALDIIYDHYLAKFWDKYHPLSLLDFTMNSYAVLDTMKESMPRKALHMYNYMKKDNWLTGYAAIEGIAMALQGLSRRTKFESNLENAIKALKKYYGEYNFEFEIFFTELKKFAEKERSLL